MKGIPYFIFGIALLVCGGMLQEITAIQITLYRQLCWYSILSEIGAIVVFGVNLKSGRPVAAKIIHYALIVCAFAVIADGVERLIRL